MDRKQLPEFFCPQPFTQLATLPTGKVTPCCVLDNFPVGHIQDNRLEEIWNSEGMQQIRRELLTGEIKICKDNIEKRQCHLWADHLLPYVDLKVVQDGPIKRLYIQNNGRCNLECVMCSIWKMPNGNYNEERFWKSGKTEIFPYLKEIVILGGEPFMQKDTYRLIDEITEASPDCHFSFVTNANYRFSRKIQQHLDKIQNLGRISISLDGVSKESFEKIRLKGNLELVMKTIQDIIQYRESRRERGLNEFAMQIQMAVQKDNYWDIKGVYEFGIKHDIEIEYNYVHSPLRYSLSDYPIEKKYLVLQDLIVNLATVHEPTLIYAILPLFFSLSNREKFRFFKRFIRGAQRPKYIADLVYEKVLLPLDDKQSLVFHLQAPDDKLLSSPHLTIVPNDREEPIAFQFHTFTAYAQTAKGMTRLLNQIAYGNDTLYTRSYPDTYFFLLAFSEQIRPYCTKVEWVNTPKAKGWQTPLWEVEEKAAFPPKSLAEASEFLDAETSDRTEGEHILAALLLWKWTELKYEVARDFVYLEQYFEEIAPNFPQSLSYYWEKPKQWAKDLGQWAKQYPKALTKLHERNRTRIEAWNIRLERLEFARRIGNPPFRDMDELFGFIGSPNTVKTTGWAALIALFPVLLEGKIFVPEFTTPAFEALTDYTPLPNPLSYYNCRQTFPSLVRAAQFWATTRLELVEYVEKSYTHAFKLWLANGDERLFAFKQMGNTPLGSLNNVFEFFGSPGHSYNTDWMSPVAVLNILLNGNLRISAEEAQTKLAPLQTLLAGFPHPLSYYFQAEKGDQFLPDLQAWCKAHPQVLPSIEAYYKQAYQNWQKQLMRV